MGTVKAVDGITFEVRRGETLGLVGESGCGKSTTGRAMIRLREPTAGTVRFDGDRPRARCKSDELRKMRRRMQIIFQDPYGSLDPRMTVGSIIAEPIETHDLAKGEAKRERVAELLEIVGLDPKYVNALPARVLRRPAAAHRRRPGARGRARVHRLRRADLARSTCRSRRRSSTC